MFFDDKLVCIHSTFLVWLVGETETEMNMPGHTTVYMPKCCSHYQPTHSLKFISCTVRYLAVS